MSRLYFPCLMIVILLSCALVGHAQEPDAGSSRFVRIGHYQCECKQGDFEANLAKLVHGLKSADALLDELQKALDEQPSK